MNRFTLLIHGGSGNISRKSMDEQAEAAHVRVMASALEAGAAVLRTGGIALDAVQAAVKVLEDCPLFNAGKGSVYTAAGTHEMDACIMDGKTRDAGAVAGIATVRSPIEAARVVLEQSPHVLLTGKEAEAFAQEKGVEMVSGDYFYDAHRWQQLQDIIGSDRIELDIPGDEAKPEAHEKMGTVGAVAVDSHGNLAAATSTGGLTNKRPGRIGDTPVTGAGTYAENATCAVSCTGQGEYFMRANVAADVAARMRYAKEPLETAAKHAIHETLYGLKGKGGLIALDAQGNYAMPFNTTGMFRGVVSDEEKPQVWMFR